MINKQISKPGETQRSCGERGIRKHVGKKEMEELVRRR
jgi:hypothetical protein